MNKRNTIVFILIQLAVFFVFCRAEDNVKKPLFDYLKFSVKGGVYSLYKGLGGEVKYPPYIVNLLRRSPGYTGLNEAFDNPLPHGAAYVSFKMSAKLKGFTLNSRIFAEHRGFSGGVYNTGKMFVYPKIHISYEDKIGLFNSEIKTRISVGNLDEFRLFEGLTIYNIDVQRISAYLKWGKVKLEFGRIADLVSGIGLGIDDEDDYILSLEDIRIAKHVDIDIRAGYTNYTDSFYNAYSTSLGMQIKDKLRCYFQLSLMNGKGEGLSFKECSAFLMGINYGVNAKKIKLNLTGEYRFYGKYFNLGFKSSLGIRYFIDNPLMPLYHMDRFFSQWAVFTEYQGKDAAGAVFQAAGRYYLSNKIFFHTMLDFNYILAEDEDPFLYHFYDIGLATEPAPDIYLGVSITNKGMNLTRSYPTFYLFKHSYISLSIRFKFDVWEK